MSVWLLYKYVDYEGIMEHSVEAYASSQKAQQEAEKRNALLRRDWHSDVTWRVKELKVHG